MPSFGFTVIVGDAADVAVSGFVALSVAVSINAQSVVVPVGV